jgi:fucose permease
VTLLATYFREPRRITITLIFALHGMTVGSLYSRVSDLQLAMDLSPAALGLAFVGIPAGVFCGSLLVSNLIEKQGTRLTLLCATPLFGLGPTLASLALGAVSLFAALFLCGLGLTTVNVTMNVEADRVEHATAARLINRCHGTWSLGVFAATLAGTAAVAAGLPPTVHFLLVFLVQLAGVAVIIAPMEPSPPRAHAGGAQRKRFALPTLGVVLILAYAAGGILLDGTTRNWSVIYLRDQFAPPAWIATLTLPSIVIAQISGRFLADGFIERFGVVRVAAVLAAVSFVGLSLVVSAGTIPTTLVGFALVGLGISTVHPQSLSAVARLGDRPSSENVAAFSTLQTVLGFVSPPFFGLIASHFSTRTAFACFLPLPLLAIAFARYLVRPGKD